jgi:hypothetical protein
VLVAREDVEAEAEEALAVVGSEGGREDVAEEGAAVVRVRVRVRAEEMRSWGVTRREAAEGGWWGWFEGEGSQVGIGVGDC